MNKQSIGDQLIIQAKKIEHAENIEGSNKKSELAKMIKSTADNIEEKSEMSNQALDVIFSGEKIDLYSKRGRGAGGSLQRYRQGIEQELMAEGFVARIFQHEYDHLNGLVYLDRVEDNKDIISETEFQKLMESKDLKVEL